MAIGERKTQAEDGQVYAIPALSFSHICHVAAVEAIAAGFRDVVERGRLKGRYGGPKVVRRCYPARILLRVLSSERWSILLHCLTPGWILLKKLALLHKSADRSPPTLLDKGISRIFLELPATPFRHIHASVCRVIT